MISVPLLCFLSLLCFSVHGITQRNLSHPGVVHGALWLIVSLGYFFFQSELNHLSPQTIGTLILGIVMFSIGITLGALSPSLTSRSSPSVLGNIPLLAIIVGISAIGLAMMIFKAVEYAKALEIWFTRPDGSITLIGSMSWIQMLRNELVLNHRGSFGTSSYVLNFCFAGVAYVILYFRRVRSTLWLWPLLALALGFAVISTGRTFILLLGCIVLGAVMSTNPRKNYRVIAIAIFSGASAFFILAWMGGRLNLLSGGPAANPFVAGVLQYFLMPMAAFDYLINADLPATWGILTFRTPLAIVKAIGAPITVPDLIQPFVKVPSAINVYTVFSPYYRDFGMAGVATFMLFFGALHGWVFRQLKTGMPIIIVANALLFYALLMQFFQDQYFSLMSQWIQILFWTYLFNKLQPLPLIADHDKP